MRGITITSNYNVTKDDTLLRYFRDVRRICKDNNEDDQTPENLIKNHLKFAISVAKKYIHNGVPFEDLIQYANLGLIKAAYSFDSTKGVKFISYCVMAMRTEIINVLRKSGIGIRHNTKLNAELNHIREVMNYLSQKDGHFYTIDELKAVRPELFNYLINDALNINNYEFVDDENTFSCQPEEDEKDRMDDIKYRVQKSLDILSVSERKVIIGLFFENKTRDALAQEMGICSEYVRMLKNKALDKLRKHRKFLLND